MRTVFPFLRNTYGQNERISNTIDENYGKDTICRTRRNARTTVGVLFSLAGIAKNQLRGR